MATKTVKVTIKGVSPLLVHAFNDEEAFKSTRGTRTSIKTQPSEPREIASKFLYRSTKNDKICIFPGNNIFRSIIDAGTFHKVGKSKVTTMKSSIVPSCIMLQEIELPIKPQKWEVDSRPVVIPATGGRIIRHRPRFDVWEMDFTLEVDDEIMNVDFVRQLVDDAGKKIGIGDFRPARKGQFGRFVVNSWKEQK